MAPFISRWFSMSFFPQKTLYVLQQEIFHPGSPKSIFQINSIKPDQYLTLLVEFYVYITFSSKNIKPELHFCLSDDTTALFESR